MNLRTPPEVRWSLSIYTTKPCSLPLICSDPSLPHCLVWIGGLTETLGTCPYLSKLAHGIAPYGFSAVQLQLSSALGGYGVCSLEGDAQEMALAVQYLRSQKTAPQDRKIILMGFSTGTQDVMTYLSHPNGPLARGEQCGIDAAILQAPVSDRQHWESYHRQGLDSDEQRKLDLATKLVKEGRGNELLSREHMPVQPATKDGVEQKGNVNAIHDPAMTAYRWWSLCGKGGHDDYFSTDIGDDNIKEIWLKASRGLKEGTKGSLLALVGEEDECIARPEEQPQGIVDLWRKLTADLKDSRCIFEVLPKANHQVDDPEAQLLLVTRVRELIKSMGFTASTASRNPLASTSAGGPAKRGPPPSLKKGIPAWQLAEPSSASPAASSATKQPSESSSSNQAVESPAIEVPGPPAGSIPPHPPSFDALVELIATGRADEIEGIRDIPLQINEAAPSQATMEVRRKPWEEKGAEAVSGEGAGQTTVTQSQAQS